MATIQQKLQAVLSQFLFEENNYITRQNILRGLNSYLSGMVVRREIKTYDVVIDESRSNNAEMFIDVDIVPVTTINKIHISLNVSN